MDLGKYIDAILPHMGTVVGFVLAFLLISRLMREKRRPSNTFAWMLIIILVPYLGVPLYILFGGRKISRLAKDKGPLNLLPQPDAESTVSVSPFGIISKGNRTHFLHTGLDAFQALIDSIQQAEKSIEITTFILSHDSVGRRIVKELSRKAEEGVEVRLLLDAIGSFGKKTLYMLELEKAGGKIERFMPVFPFLTPSRANLRNHRKIAIFDQKKAIIGGRNIGRDYMGPVRTRRRWRDFGVSIEGPAVTQLMAIFEADWHFASKRSVTPRSIDPVRAIDSQSLSSIEIMASGPDTRGDPIYEKILSVIQEAERSIIIATPYYLPDEVLQRSLIVKARTGKRVTMIVPRRSNHPVTDLARNHYLRELAEAGVNVLLYNRGMMHGKVALVDDQIGMTGSANVDFRSLFVNYEVGAFFYSDNDIDEFKHWIQSLEDDSITYQEEHQAPPTFLMGVLEDLSRLLTPLL